MKSTNTRLNAPTGIALALNQWLHCPIPAGPLKGMRWLPLSGGKLLRVLEGSYEPEQSLCFARELKEGSCLFDVGSHVGWYSLLSSRLVGNTGKIIAFEASPRNYWFLQQHIYKNRINNIITEHLGVSEQAGRLSFQAGTGTGTGRLADDGDIQVTAISLDDYCQQHQLIPTHLKIDVEGGEMAVLRGARSLLEQHQPLIFLSTHGKDIKQHCIDYLTDLGYRFEVMHDGKTLDDVADFICRHS